MHNIHIRNTADTHTHTHTDWNGNRKINVPKVVHSFFEITQSDFLLRAIDATTRFYSIFHFIRLSSVCHIYADRLCAVGAGAKAHINMKNKITLSHLAMTLNTKEVFLCDFAWFSSRVGRCKFSPCWFSPFYFIDLFNRRAVQNLFTSVACVCVCVPLYYMCVWRRTSKIRGFRRPINKLEHFDWFLLCSFHGELLFCFFLCESAWIALGNRKTERER